MHGLILSCRTFSARRAWFETIDANLNFSESCYKTNMCLGGCLPNTLFYHIAPSRADNQCLSFFLSALQVPSVLIFNIISTDFADNRRQQGWNYWGYTRGYILRLYTEVIYWGYILRLYTEVIYCGYIYAVEGDSSNYLKLVSNWNFKIPNPEFWIVYRNSDHWSCYHPTWIGRRTKLGRWLEWTAWIHRLVWHIRIKLGPSQSERSEIPADRLIYGGRRYPVRSPLTVEIENSGNCLTEWDADSNSIWRGPNGMPPNWNGWYPKIGPMVNCWTGDLLVSRSGNIFFTKGSENGFWLEIRQAFIADITFDLKNMQHARCYNDLSSWKCMSWKCISSILRHTKHAATQNPHTFLSNLYGSLHASVVKFIFKII